MSNQTGLHIRQHPFALSLAAGTLTLTGQPATLTYTPAICWQQWIGYQPAGSASTFSNTWRFALSGPSVIIVVIIALTSTLAPQTVSDTAGNTYSLDHSTTPSNGVHAWTYRASNNSTASNVTLTVKMTGSCVYSFFAAEFTGLNTLVASSNANTAAGVGGLGAAGSFATVASGSLVIGGFGTGAGGLANPTVTPAYPALATTASGGQTLPQSTINVASVTNFPSSGTLQVDAGGAFSNVTYTGTAAGQFTGCSGGGGTLGSGDAVDFAFALGLDVLTSSWAMGASYAVLIAPVAGTSLSVTWKSSTTGANTGISGNYSVQAPVTH